MKIPTRFKRKTGGMALDDRIWLHQVKQRCQSRAPNQRCSVLSVDDPGTDLDMHLPPNHGI
jgi:hypothetical protein